MTPRTRTIRQTIMLKATPHEIYAALTDGKLHSAFTGSAATIKPLVAAFFTAYDGYISGKNLDLKEDKKIVWAWRADEPGWPADHDSRVTIRLKLKGDGTELDMVHAGVPEDHADAIAEGWDEYYWQPLKRMVER